MGWDVSLVNDKSTESLIISSVNSEFISRGINISDELFNSEKLVEMYKLKGISHSYSYPYTPSPGVYVWLDTKKNKAIKVGKHNENVVKRAFEHFKANTHTADIEMQPFSQNNFTGILLLVFYLDNNNIHWVLALEDYLEKSLREQKLLLIPSKRRC